MDIFFKIVGVITTLGFISIAIWTNSISKQNNDLVSKLGADKLTPKLQVRPVKFVKEWPVASQGTVVFEVINYSDFDAFDVISDLQYPGCSWIVSWNKGRADDLKKKGGERTLEEDKELKQRELYISPITKIKSKAGYIRILGGALPQDIFSLSKEEGNYPLKIRLGWRSEDGRSFNEIYRYKLIHTKVGKGEDFLFIGG